MLATDELIRKAYTTTTNLTQTIPAIWRRQLEKNLRYQAIFDASIVDNTDLLGSDGDRVYIPILPDLGMADALTEGTDMTDIALNNSQVVPLVPTEYGKMVRITRKALDRISFDGIAEIVDRLSYAMALRLQTLIVVQWNKQVKDETGAAVGANNGYFVVQYPNGKTSTTITSSDTFSGDCILNAVAQLENNLNVPFEDGYYRLFISPNQYKALIDDQNIRQDLRWAAPERLISGEKGALHGCRIIVTPYVPQTAHPLDPSNSIYSNDLNVPQEGAAGSLTNVAKAFCMAPRAIARAWKRRAEVVVDPTLYDAGRYRRVGVTSDVDVKPLHSERMVVITTAN